jgi:spermidine/putrescine-binding protein
MKTATRHSLQLLVLLAAGVALIVYWRSSSKPVLRLYIWNDYIYSDVIADFEREAGVRVKVENYTSNAEMLARVKVSWNEFDVIMPSSYMIETMRQYGLLVKLNQFDVPRRINIADEFLISAPQKELLGSGPLLKIKAANIIPVAPKIGGELSASVEQRDDAYALPYLWNSAGIGYSKTEFPGGAAGAEPPRTWSEFFHPDMAAKHGRRLMMLDEPRELIGLALISLGKNPNTRDKEEIKAAGRVLNALNAAGRPRLVLSEGASLLRDGEGALLHTWSPEITRAQDRFRTERPGQIDRVERGWLRLSGWFEDLFIPAVEIPRRRPEIGYQLPEDGTLITVDTLAIPRSSGQQRLALRFINFLLDPKIAARVSERSSYANTLKNAPVPSLAGTPSVRRPTERRFYLSSVGDAEHVYDSVWAEFSRGNTDEGVDTRFMSPAP